MVCKTTASLVNIKYILNIFPNTPPPSYQMVPPLNSVQIALHTLLQVPSIVQRLWYRMAKLYRATVLAVILTAMATCICVWILVVPNTLVQQINLKAALLRSRRPCSLSALKEVFLKEGMFPNATHWTDDKELVSDFCEFRSDSRTLKECLTTNGIKSIAVIGDSNVNNVLKSVLALIGGCKVVKQERLAVRNGMQPDARYFSKTNNGHMTHERHCVSCLSNKTTCKVGGKDIVVEYISMEYLWDTEITTFRLNKKATCRNVPGFRYDRPCPQSHSTQQFVYKEYFRTNYPDLILHFTPSHDKDTMTPVEVLMAAEMLGRMFEIYVPKTTDVIVFSKVYEEVFIKPEKWRKVKYEGRYDILQQVQRENIAVSHGLHRAIEQNSNIHVFFDLFKMGEGVAHDWGLDGIHKKPIWYDTLLKYFTKVLCHTALKYGSVF